MRDHNDIRPSGCGVVILCLESVKASLEQKEQCRCCYVHDWDVHLDFSVVSDRSQRGLAYVRRQQDEAR